MKIVHFPHVALVTKSKPVTLFDASLETLANQMIDLMHKASGVGLAANQVALDKRIVVMQCRQDKPPYVFINPQIVASGESIQKGSEGCLSFPSLSIEVPRQEWVELKWQDTKGDFYQETFFGLEAVCVQHEIDHLNGINFVDRLGNVKKMMTLKKYNSRKN